VDDGCLAVGAHYDQVPHHPIVAMLRTAGMEELTVTQMPAMITFWNRCGKATVESG
jgi:hypothetical protein